MAPVDVILAEKTCGARPRRLYLSGALHFVHDDAADDSADHGGPQIDTTAILPGRTVGLMPAVAIVKTASAVAAMLHPAPVLIIAVAVLHLYQIISDSQLRSETADSKRRH